MTNKRWLVVLLGVGVVVILVTALMLCSVRITTKEGIETPNTQSWVPSEGQTLSRQSST